MSTEHQKMGLTVKMVIYSSVGDCRGKIRKTGMRRIE